MHVLMFVLAALSLINCCLSDDILGCGGFVKSDVAIDFSEVEIQLFTSEGMLKYQTECAPNNGYFMVPFVEKGNFVLKIDPPKGWLFEPMSVVLNVDGVTDDCTKGKDINFVFKGFVVTGQVSSAGLVGTGPQGVTVEIKSAISGDIAGTTESLNGGSFSFEGILPGDYEVVASHKTLIFDKKSTTVKVLNGNAKCMEDLVVSGYNIQGKVSVQSLSVTGVKLLLFTKTKPPKDITGCAAEKPEGTDHLTSPGYPIFVCTATSDGQYIFPNLPPADYAIVPYHKGERTQYDIEPQVLEVSVKNSHIVKGTGFTVTGYSVQGRVLYVVNGKPVEGAQIFIKNKQHDVTNSDGYYTIKHKHSPAQSADQGAVLEITVKKEHVDFDVTKIEIGPGTKVLPNIIAKSFSVCGHIHISNPPLESFSPTQIFVEISSKNKNAASQKINADKDGLFCFMKPPGKYTLKTVVPKSIEKEGLVLLPSNIEATVISSPVEGIVFSQYQAQYKVKLSCIASCEDVLVELIPDLAEIKKQKVVVTDNSNVTSVNFRDLLPIGYTVRVSHNNWCWVKEDQKVQLSKEPVHDAVEQSYFEQSGFVLVCSISHDIELIIHHAGERVNTFSLKKGRNRLCLSRLGEYTLEPRSCHRFDIPSPLVYNTARPKPVTLHATAHEAVVVMETTKAYLDSEHSEEKIAVQLRSSRGKVTKDYFIKYEDNSAKGGSVLYRLSYWASDGEKLDIIPSSNILLFSPTKHSVTMQAGGCSTELARFKGIVGVFINGVVSPPLSNVKITITTNKTAEEPTVLKTDKHGKYSIGPLYPDDKYAVNAYLEDYVMTPVDGKPGWFDAKKLSKLIFKIYLEDQETPLPGVLLSISGGDYRSNNLTEKDGSLTLTKLEPGQYYFKAIMKEYQFTPPSQVIEIVEGAKTEIGIKGKRVAYSAYGSVTSLNGEPESGTTVRALAKSDNEQCSGLGEDGSTGNDGGFRIKGLRPGCVYEISIRDSNGRYSRVVPEKVTIDVSKEDIDDVKFIAFRPLSGFELSGKVITSQEYLPYIKMALYRSGDSSSAPPVHVVSLTKATPFFQMPTLSRDQKEYVIKLESSLSRSSYEYTAPAAGFFASGPHKHITFRFEPQKKLLEPETSPVSILALPLTVLAILLAYNYTQVLAMIERLYHSVVTSRVASDNNPNRGHRKSKK